MTSAGPWRSSGAWWGAASEDAEPDEHDDRQERLEAWDRDEWDVALATGAVYRIYRDRVLDDWFVDGVVD